MEVVPGVVDEVSQRVEGEGVGQGAAAAAEEVVAGPQEQQQAWVGGDSSHTWAKVGGVSPGFHPGSNAKDWYRKCQI